MKNSSIKLKMTRIVAAFAVFFALFHVQAKAGADGFEVYLNNKLIQKSWVGQPLDLKSLDLSKANANDHLTIFFTQCHAPGKLAKGRGLVVKDEQGKVLKEWKFDDSDKAEPGMIISVKDILALQNTNNEKALTLCYQANNRPQPVVVASLRIKVKSV
jgi:hypothetical protein